MKLLKFLILCLIVLSIALVVLSIYLRHFHLDETPSSESNTSSEGVITQPLTTSSDTSSPAQPHKNRLLPAPPTNKSITTEKPQEQQVVHTNPSKNEARKTSPFPTTASNQAEADTTKKTISSDIETKNKKDKSTFTSESASESLIEKQRANLKKNTEGKGYGPQSPRNIDEKDGNNTVSFSQAPPYTEMNLCNIHFHKNAEHKGGEFTKFAGSGDGHGYKSGYKYSGTLTKAEIASLDYDICPSKHGSIYPGDTIEVHYVYSTAKVKPGHSLSSCLSETNNNPQLRVEAQIYVVVNDKNALNFNMLNTHGERDGFQQVLTTPNNTGKPIQYRGSTTGPSYNEKGSPFHVTWSVRPKVAKVNIETVGEWCRGNSFFENYGHGVRNLIKNPKLLSNIEE